MSVVVVGSFIVDCIARCDRALKRARRRWELFNIYLGGKGANQAFAAIRMGSKTIMAGAVGDDVFGKDFMKFKKGFDCSFVKVVKNFTGTSLVTVEESGQNRICMTPGANLDYAVDDLNTLEKVISKSNVVVTQLEMRYEIAKRLSELAKKHNKKFILNPAPARKIDNDLLKNVYIITPNETELGVIIDKRNMTFEDYIEGAKNYKRGVENVIVTLGDKGSLLVNKAGHQFVKACKALNYLVRVMLYLFSRQIDHVNQLLSAMHVANVSRH